MRQENNSTSFLIASLLTTLLFFSNGFAQDSLPASEIGSKLDEQMTALTERGQFSGAILVARDSQLLLNKGYGMANAELAVQNIPQTKFRIASNTKQMTAMAIMMLQERGKLSVRDSLCKYIPRCPANWRGITLRHLLTHTSGIIDFDDLEDDETSSECKPRKFSQTIASVQHRPLEFKPGFKFSYSNSNYVLLGHIIEKLSGTSYEKFLQQNIFEPLKMVNTGYDHPETILTNRASGYVRIKNILLNAPLIDMSWPHAAGGLYSTTEDMYLWSQALDTERLVSQKSLDEIFTPFKGDYGYGWWIEPQFHRKSEAHAGQIDGFVSNITRYPDEKVTIIVLSNLENSRANIIALNLAAIIFNEQLLPDNPPSK